MRDSTLAKLVNTLERAVREPDRIKYWHRLAKLTIKRYGRCGLWGVAYACGECPMRVMDEGSLVSGSCMFEDSKISGTLIISHYSTASRLYALIQLLATLKSIQDREASQ